MVQVVQTPDQHYYFSKLMGYNYEIKYKRGKDNKATDALPRSDSPSDSQILFLTTKYFYFLKHVKHENETSEELQTMHQ